MSTEIDIDAIADSSKQLDEAAQAMVAQVAGNRSALHTYGEALSSVAVRLDQD